MASTVALAVVLAKSQDCIGAVCNIIRVDGSFAGLSYAVWAVMALPFGIDLSKPEAKRTVLVVNEKADPATHEDTLKSYLHD
jgi:hypothetical protein